MSFKVFFIFQGVKCKRVARSIASVGLYVPGGTAVLPSTALMLAIVSLSCVIVSVFFSSLCCTKSQESFDVYFCSVKLACKDCWM